MSSKVDYDDLPQYLKRVYDRERIHKVVRRSKTTIVIHTKDKLKHVWNSVQEGWVLANGSKLN